MQILFSFCHLENKNCEIIFLMYSDNIIFIAVNKPYKYGRGWHCCQMLICVFTDAYGI